jgi:arabinofuranosyltransferase
MGELRRRLVPVLVCVLYASVLLRSAWVGDDAYITFRTVDNFLHGDGLTWNPGERVQAYTHPLWMLLLAGVQAVTREVWLSTSAVALLLSLAALLTLRRAAGSVAAFCLVAAFLAVSKAHVDFAMSGLENPLAHLLLVVFAVALLKSPGNERAVWVAALAAGWCVLVRLDLLLLVLPGTLLALASLPGRRVVSGLIATIAPVAAWSLFSLWYYGFALPNTAYAKLGTGIPPADLARQGLRFLADSFRLDPATLLTMSAAVVILLAARRLREAALVEGVFLYVAYVVAAGGDFMSGRFLTAPHMLAVAGLAGRLAALPSRPVAVAAALVLAAGAVPPRSPLRAGPDYGTRPELLEVHDGIADERAQYYDMTGILRREGAFLPPQPDAAIEGLLARLRGETPVLRPNVGFFAFHAGPGVHVIDPYGLADPLLARLPISPSHVDPVTKTRWRIGHFARDVPRGYFDTLRTGRNSLADPDLARWYDHLCVLTQGDLRSPARLREIVREHLGRYEPWRKAYLRGWPGVTPVRPDEEPH